MNEPHYYDPQTGARHALDEPRWCSDARTPLMISPLAGMSRDDIDTRARSLGATGPRCRASSTRRSPWARAARPWPSAPGALCVRISSWSGSTRPAASGSRCGGDAVLAAPDRHRRCRRGQLGQRRRGHRGVRRGGRHGGDHLRAGLCLAGQDRAIRAFGADVRLVDGPREASQDAAIRASGELYYASHNWQPFFLQGTKSIAYEMWRTSASRRRTTW